MMMNRIYRHHIGLKGSSYLYSKKEHPTHEELWEEYRYGDSPVHPEDLDIELIETYEINEEDLHEIRKVEPKEDNDE